MFTEMPILTQPSGGGNTYVEDKVFPANNPLVVDVGFEPDIAYYSAQGSGNVYAWGVYDKSGNSASMINSSGSCYIHVSNQYTPTLSGTTVTFPFTNSILSNTTVTVYAIKS